jgi:hypothetical protein
MSVSDEAPELVRPSHLAPSLAITERHQGREDHHSPSGSYYWSFEGSISARDVLRTEDIVHVYSWLRERWRRTTQE